MGLGRVQERPDEIGEGGHPGEVDVAALCHARHVVASPGNGIPATYPTSDKKKSAHVHFEESGVLGWHWVLSLCHNLQADCELRDPRDIANQPTGTASASVVSKSDWMKLGREATQVMSFFCSFLALLDQVLL